MCNQRVQHARPYRQAHWSSLFTLFLLACLFVLNACGSSHNSQSIKKARDHAQAAVTTSLRQQGQVQLRTFEQWIALMRQFQGNASSYQRDYTSDERALNSAASDAAYRTAMNTLTKHVNSIKIAALKTEAENLQQQLSQQYTAWSQDHTYRDSYNGTTYHLGFEYGPDGMGGIISDDLSSAKTADDYQQAVEDASTALISFRAYKDNLNNSTSWDKTHLADLLLMQHYGFTNQKVIVISLSEQTMRVYNGAQLVKAFHVTTGRPAKPSLPGSWEVENKLSPTVFKSDAPVGSTYWYPDTPIHYALLYHSGGYFIHDSWWRDDYGPGTQFPHVDSSGDSFSFDGSHGCVNVATGNAAWIYQYVDTHTHVLIY